jgi:hypothetical protein
LITAHRLERQISGEQAEEIGPTHASGATFSSPERVLINGEQQFASFAAVLTTANRLPETLKLIGQAESGHRMNSVSRKIDGQTCVRRLLALLQYEGRYPSPVERFGSSKAGDAATRDQHAIRSRDTHRGWSFVVFNAAGQVRNPGAAGTRFGTGALVSATRVSDARLLNSSSATCSS